MEKDSSIPKRILKSRVLGTKNQVSSSSSCKYNLLQKADIVLKNLCRLGKAGRFLRVQELRCRKCILHSKKVNVYLEKKGKI